MDKDVEIQQMIDTGVAVNAKNWLLEHLGNRRIGEAPEKRPNFWTDNIDRGFMINTWVSGFQIDADGSEFAEIEIYELPKKKGYRKAAFTGLNMRMALSEMPLLNDVGQKYVMCKTPSAAQVIKAKKQIRKL
jgi:hypothetical protein